MAGTCGENGQGEPAKALHFNSDGTKKVDQRIDGKRWCSEIRLPENYSGWMHKIANDGDSAAKTG